MTCRLGKRRFCIEQYAKYRIELPGSMTQMLANFPLFFFFFLSSTVDKNFVNSARLAIFSYAVMFVIQSCTEYRVNGVLCCVSSIWTVLVFFLIIANVFYLHGDELPLPCFDGVSK